MPQREGWTSTPATVPPPERRRAWVSVPLSASDEPAPTVFAPVNSHDAPPSAVTTPKLVKLVPSPVSVPVPPPDANSRTLLALVLPATVPLNTAPGTTPTRLFPVPANDTAVPPLPVMVPAFVA